MFPLLNCSERIEAEIQRGEKGLEIKGALEGFFFN